ncbi:MAG: UDP-N-acetylglucosamine--N-acetylmuramyl-(pentapeptide) pyrophosphoryl-undecaprenol N-acetylglucosamine transferase, partial [Polyangiales bacterium]
KPRVARKVRVCGNPIRRDFVHAVRRLAADPDGVEARARIISVIGGSQGARALNEAVPALLAQVGVAHSRLEVWHQSGAAMQAEVEARYRRLGIRARVLPFIDDMASLYARSRLVVARAGAGTVAELCAVGRPSLLVPYPHAADDHQRRNAERLAAAGAALWAPESELSSPALAAQLRAALVDPAERTRMATAARNLGAPDAAATLVDDLLAWMGGEAPSVAPDGPASGTQPPGVATLSAYLPRRRSAGGTTPMALDRRPLLSFSGALH